MANNIIVLNRGDSYSFNLTIIDENSESGIYSLEGNDTVYLGIMDPNQPFELALVKKKYTVEDLDEAGNLFIEILPEDTVDLFPGIYYYSIKLKIDHTDDDGFEFSGVKTIINNTKFILCD